MIVIFRNFLRNKMVNLTAQSVKHFVPNTTFYCLTLYKKDYWDDYADQEPLLPYITQFARPTKYVSSNQVHDHEDSTKTSGYQNGDNAKYFTEGFNYIMEVFKGVDQKVLILAEDHFFTTGAVLKELQDNEFDLAIAPWDVDDDANGSVICWRPTKVAHLFPLPEGGAPIEILLKHTLVDKVENVYKIKNRKHADYFGDGKYTNSSVEIEEELKKAGIL